MRLLAYLIDSIVYSLIIIMIVVMFYSLSLFSKFSFILNNETIDSIFLFFVILLIFILRWFYNIVIEFATNGMSIGKFLFKIRVIDIKGGYLTLSTIILRNFSRIIDENLTSYLGVFFSMVFDKYFRRIGDIVAGTVVIREDKFNPVMPDFSINYQDISIEKKILQKKLTEEELYILRKFLNSLNKWDEKKRDDMILKMANKIKNRISDKEEFLDPLKYLKEVYMRHINE